MKKFTVRPALTKGRTVRIGGGAESDDWVLLGRLGEAGALTQVVQDTSQEHVVAIVGKRGSGKSYTLGSFLEGLCVQPNQTPIAATSGKHAILLFDTLGIFQWSDVKLSSQAQSTVVRDQDRLKQTWKLPDIETNISIWRPASDVDGEGESNHKSLTIRPADLDASSWGYLLGIDLLQDRMGQLLAEAYSKVASDGWKESDKTHAAETNFEITDLVDCVANDQDINDTYHPETRRALIQQLGSFARLTLFHSSGIELSELLVPGTMSVIVMNKLSDAMRFVLIVALIRKIMSSRIEASEAEKTLLIRDNITEQETISLRETISRNAPPCWIAADEAQNFLPSERRTNSADTLVRLVREGRNFGVSFVLTTQQPLAIDNRIMAQVDTLVSHKLTVHSDIDYVRKNLKSLLPDEITHNNQTLSIDTLLRNLDTGQALVSSTEGDRSMIVDIRPRVSVHGGF